MNGVGSPARRVARYPAAAHATAVFTARRLRCGGPVFSQASTVALSPQVARHPMPVASHLQRRLFDIAQPLLRNRAARMKVAA